MSYLKNYKSKIQKIINLNLDKKIKYSIYYIINISKKIVEQAISIKQITLYSYIRYILEIVELKY